MKYVILSDSDNVEPFIIPRQLSKINGETLIGRTIRLLKENGVKDIIITSHDPRFDNLGATRYEPKFNDYKPKENKGYWLSAFPRELLTEPIVFLLGDVYYSENAIEKIVNTETESVLFFCSDKTKGYDERYIKHHDEPFAFKVKDYKLFLKHIDIVKEMKDKKLTKREPIAWELYRSINGIDISEHKLTENYIAINDETCDVDRTEDVYLIELKLGGNKMVKVKVIEMFTLGKFAEIEKSIVRKNPEQKEKGYLYVGDTFECTEEMARYLTGENKVHRALIEIIEVVPEEEIEIKEEDIIPEEEAKEIKEEEVAEVKAKKVTVKKSTKKTTTRKKK